MRLSRTGDHAKFLPSTAVMLGEFLKLVVSIAVVIYSSPDIKSLRTSLNTILTPQGLIQVSIPAMLYVVQNNLQYLAVSNLNAPTFQVLSQLKILTTAVFAVLILKKSIVPLQWGAIVILMFGVALVQLDNMNGKSSESDTLKLKHEMNQSPTLGLVAVISGCLCSGFAGIYFEKILKHSKGIVTSLWERNVQMSLISLLLGSCGLYYQDMAYLQSQGFFHGYRPIVWVTVCISALGGLLTAVVVKYADNILKAFATSVAVVLSVLISIVLFDQIPTVQFLIGGLLVNGSVVLYAKSPAASSSTIKSRSTSETRNDTLPLKNQPKELYKKS